MLLQRACNIENYDKAFNYYRFLYPLGGYVESSSRLKYGTVRIGSTVLNESVRTKFLN